MACWWAVSCLAIVAMAASMPVADFESWDRVVHRHVRAGVREGIELHVVDYAGIGPDADFQSFIESLAHANTTGLTKNATYALFMNAYNALAIKMIIDNPCKHNALGKCTGPISSIKDIGGVVPVWDKPAGVLGGKSYSLQQIEDFLRNPAPMEEDSRVHACIVCASISCPNVRTEAFVPEHIDSQMDDQLFGMLSNPLKGFALNKTSAVVTLSKIFSWYAGDFQKAAGSVLDFILPHLVQEDQEYIATHKSQIELQYFDYDWNANGPVPCNCTR